VIDIAQAKADLPAAGYDYVEVPLAHQIRTKVVGALSGEGTVPQVFINGERIGGADAVRSWLAKRS
jgi:glutaredoxin-related protein